jgi:dienelactone hydrolase
VGDSRPLGTRNSPELEALQSVEAGLDELQAMGVADRFVLVGLCSGANHSAQVAARDRRVVGAVLIDPPGLPPTFAHHVRRVVRASLRPRVLLRLLRGRYGLLRVAANRLFESGGDDPAWEMNRAGIVKILRTLVERDTRLLFVVTDSLSHVYSYPDQLFDIFPEVDLRRIVRSVLLPGAEHTFPRASDRDRLEREVEGWLRDQTFRGDADGAEAEPREGLGSR